MITPQEILDRTARDLEYFLNHPFGEGTTTIHLYCVMVLIAIGYEIITFREILLNLFISLFTPIIPVVEGIKALAYFLHLKKRPRDPDEPWFVDVGGYVVDMG